MPRKITNNDIQKKINSLSINEIITILDNYSKETGSSSKDAESILSYWLFIESLHPLLNGYYNIT